VADALAAPKIQPAGRPIRDRIRCPRLVHCPGCAVGPVYRRGDGASVDVVSPSPGGRLLDLCAARVGSDPRPVSV